MAENKPTNNKRLTPLVGGASQQLALHGTSSVSPLVSSLLKPQLKKMDSITVEGALSNSQHVLPPPPHHQIMPSSSMLQDFNAMLNGVQTTTTTTTMAAKNNMKNGGFAQPVFGQTPSFAPGFTNFESGKAMNDTTSEVGGPFKGFSGFKPGNSEDVIGENGASFSGSKQAVQNPEISPMSTKYRYYPRNKQRVPFEEEMVTPVSNTQYFNLSLNTPIQTRRQVREQSRTNSAMPSPYIKQSKMFGSGSDFKDAINLNQPSMVFQSSMNSTRNNGHMPFNSIPSFNRQSSFSLTAQAYVGLAGQVAPGGSFNTPINAYPYFPLNIGASPNLDDYKKVYLQVSANPQMSEIPKEERVQYAYNKQQQLQRKINRDPDDDEIFHNTPTQSLKKKQVALAERSERGVSIQTSPEQNRPAMKQSGRTTQVSTPKPSLATIRQKKQTGSEAQAPTPNQEKSSVVKIVKITPAVPSKMTAKQKRLSCGSETLKIDKRQSSGKSTIATTPKQTEKTVKTKSRKKALEKETNKIKKVFQKVPLVSSNSLSESQEDIVSPEFGGIAARKKKVGQVGRPKLQLQRAPMSLPDRCQCSRSRCLKLYCECFAKQGFCSPECGCTNCFNVAGQEAAIEAAKADITKRDPNAFVKKLEMNQNKLQHRKGCTCKRSGCSKGYCECFQLGVPCMELCKCTGCTNCGPAKQETTPKSPAKTRLKPVLGLGGRVLQGGEPPHKKNNPNGSNEKLNNKNAAQPATQQKNSGQSQSQSSKQGNHTSNGPSSPSRPEVPRTQIGKRRRQGVSVASIVPAPAVTSIAPTDTSSLAPKRQTHSTQRK